MAALTGPPAAAADENLRERLGELTSLDLNDPDVHFNLQLATRAWGTLRGTLAERATAGLPSQPTW